MKKELIEALFKQFEQACYEHKGIECWSARELQQILGYLRWENFFKVIEKAKNSCENSGIVVSDHFRDITKSIPVPKGGQRQLQDIALTRYACYLIAQSGDTQKDPIAFAQTYFAVQTRKQEIVEKRLLDIDRLNAREKLSKSEKVLSGIIYERGVDDKGFARIRSKGDEALFGGFTTRDMKRKLIVPENRALADFLPTITIKAKDLAAEITSHNVVEKDLKGEDDITEEHVDNNTAVRNVLLERGVKPESLPPAEDVDKVKKRIEKEDKNALNQDN
ncbi:DNA damage-inducible protein D [Chitinophaga ginsengisegetis]|uniref:DNA damage-inducible protein D n=1 Tax=Chitinophaga ginsengisegetis TaxID=393003 RepID=UPI000DB967FF|nr:DNA damage-inducible protein D [Chitinophaga ginsengisegetis]MDR6566189.1 DNA-damage-inducible protein D [Chitinophaga ginsengisegetis]MDR6645919.1 DNA-damage-inducible protein D [Chitinophaga ginsengisegetis]MDR6651489.1 DNA-damage-inducible protein D [Chitinophaga ginsengisegetis]